MSERHGRQSVRRRKSWIVPDRKLEESVILSNNHYLRSYLPADDLSPMMYQEGLLTEEEYAYYKQLKAIATTGANKSEYLMRCLIKRRDGYLRKVCEILCSITGAEHIAEHLDEQYVKVTKAGVASLSLPGSKWVSQSLQDISDKSDDRKDGCSKCKNLKQDNKRLRKTQRLLEVQLEALRRENQQLRQTSVLSQNLIQSSKRQLELVEENSRELKNLAPVFQRAAVLIERSSVAQIGLSANLSHTAEWLEHTLHRNIIEKNSKQSTDQLQSEHLHCVRQSSIQTQSSSTRFSSSSQFSSECEEELRFWVNEHSLASKELHQLSAHIVAAFPATASHESHSVVSDHHLLSGMGPFSCTDGGSNAAIKSSRAFSQSDDGYNHLIDPGVYNQSKDTAVENSKQKTQASRVTHGGRSSPHLRKKFQT